MPDIDRSVLKQNAEALANLLTENVPILLSHFLQSGVLTEAEREDIISAKSPSEIRVKLVNVLVDKEEVSIDDVLEGLNLTENYSVSEEITNLLAGNANKSDDAEEDGSGDKLEEVSAYATDLVDEVIAIAEEKTSSQQLHITDELENGQESEQNSIEEESQQLNGSATMEDIVTNGIETEKSEPAVEEFIEFIETDDNKLIETNAQVHKIEVDDNDTQPKVSGETNDEDDKEEEMQLPADDNIESGDDSFNNKIEASNGDDHEKADDDVVCQDTVKATELSAPGSPISPVEKEEVKTFESEIESELNIKTEVNEENEVHVPSNAESNLNVNGNGCNNSEQEESKTVTNGGRRDLTRMPSNDVILDEKEKTAENNNLINNAMNQSGSGDSEIEAILARKALVRQQVAMFEKNQPASPTPTVKYSIRSASSPNSQDQADAKGEERGANVRNLKNFFQQLSSPNTKTPPPSGEINGPSKQVGKLKVTFPTS